MDSEPLLDPVQSNPASESPAPTMGAGRSAYIWPFAAVVGLLALVAVMSAANPVAVPLPEGRTDRLELFKTVAVIAVSGVFAAVVFAILFHRAVIARRSDAPLQHTLVRAMPITAIAVAMLALMTIARVHLDTSDIRTVVYVITNGGGRPPEPFGIRDERSPTFRDRSGRGRAADTVFVEAERLRSHPPGYIRILFITAAIALTLALLTSSWRNRRSGFRGHDDVSTTEEETVHDALVDTIDAMLDDPDPNTAIIGAYARLTENLAACGLGRLDQEGPMEHLRRVLSRVNVRSEPLHRLIHLFEVARFSTHPLTAAHREQALAALQAVAVEIATLAANDALAARAEAVR